MNKRLMTRIAGGFFAFVGLGVILFVLWPLIFYNLPQATRFKHYLSPVPEDYVWSAEPVDYTKVSNWFEVDTKIEIPSKIQYYNISIPKLGIKDALVTIGGEDLNDSLIQYPGTALPGKRGNAVIFGHSILPQFYNPKDYLAIFSTLTSMKKEDEIKVRYDGVEYSYVVEEIFEVSPSDLEILAQNLTSSYLTLVTCTPPGHPLRPRRLIVRARLNPLAKINSDGQISWNRLR